MNKREVISVLEELKEKEELFISLENVEGNFARYIDALDYVIDSTGNVKVQNQLKELRTDLVECEEVETNDKDIDALEYVLSKLTEEMKCNCCLKSYYVVIIDSIKLCKDCLNRIKEISL